MSLSNSKCWYSSNCLPFSKPAKANNIITLNKIMEGNSNFVEHFIFKKIAKSFSDCKKSKS
jgi:hypothetical protein